MKLVFDPVLHIGSCESDRWRFSIHMTLQGVPAEGPAQIGVTAPDDGVVIRAARKVAEVGSDTGVSVWAWDVEARREAGDRGISYAIRQDGRETSFGPVVVPARGRLPRIAFFTCNGFSSAGLARRTPHRHALWSRMAECHSLGLDSPAPDDPCAFHLLLGGGDQLYADSLKILQELDHKTAREKKRKVRDSEKKRAVREYLDLYEKRWGRGPDAEVRSRIPGAFTWDDHDIFDGWGSQRPEIQRNPHYRNLFHAARRCFTAFQLGGDPDAETPPPLVFRGPGGATGRKGPFLQSLAFHEEGAHLDVLLLDLRNDRGPVRRGSEDFWQVMSAGQWQDLKAWLKAHRQAAGEVPRHLLVISSIPLAFLRFTAADWILRRLVPGAQEIEDDLLDQWEHPAHHGERDRLILTLLRHQARARCRVTLLSGDVHVGAQARIESGREEHRDRKSGRRGVIEQIISSGIVHPPPGSSERFLIEAAGTEGPFEVADGVVTRLVPVDARNPRIWRRNWLAIGFDFPAPRPRLWARWIAEGAPVTRQVIVEP